ncbi:MAG: BolA family protein [Thiomonas sp.]|nr:BolA family protein [Thiomonas sp. X19]
MHRAQRIEQALRLALDPEQLQVIDESASHAGHGGFDAQGSHFRVRMVSHAFSGKSRLARHRLVYDALASMLAHDIHALVLDLHAPGDLSKPPQP